jgi:hypothetical protein
MTKEELIYLFEKYLKRQPNSHEFQTHERKNYDQFEIEISECPERKLLNPAKIAILLSGHIRNLNILNSIIDISKRHSVDLFVFSWDNVGLKGKETNLNDEVDYKLIESRLSKLPNVKAYKIENNKKFILKNQNSKVTYLNYSSPEVFIKSQLYSIHNSFKLLEEYVKNNDVEYEMVVKCRMDSDFIRFNPDSSLFKDINENNIIFVPNSDCDHIHPDYGTSCWACDNMYYKHNLKRVHIFEHTNIVCDLFAYGSFKSMKKYCSLYNEYDKLNETFTEENLRSIENGDIVYTKENNVYRLPDSCHTKSTYYLNCSYPERLLQKYLRDYMLVRSEKIKMRFYR